MRFEAGELRGVGGVDGGFVDERENGSGEGSKAAEV